MLRTVDANTRKTNQDRHLKDQLVRIGAFGHVGRFRAADGFRYRRGVTVICRTQRGLEVGSVLNILQSGVADLPLTGTILRAATPEDHLLWARIEKNRAAAFNECQQLLDEDGLNATLMDVELLFDAGTIFFYFLGESPPEVAGLTAKLAAAYEAKVQLRKFADAMADGCGPDCGTKDGSCGDSGSCSSCSLTGGCGIPKQ